MHDICDGDLFATHPILQRNDKALQIVAYFDEVTITNPIGPKNIRYVCLVIIATFILVFTTTL